jgi:hypothetical protein
MSIAIKLGGRAGYATDLDYKKPGYTEDEHVFNACVNFAVANIVQAARDIDVDCTIHEGMKPSSRNRRKELRNERARAKRWVAHPDTGTITFAECVEYVNYALVASRRPEIPLGVLQKVLLESQSTITSAFGAGSQTTPREQGFDDLDYLMVSGQ